MEGDRSAALQTEGGDPFAPIVVNRPAQRLAPPFRVVAFNAQGCGHPDAIARRLSRAPLAGAAVILLSELDWGLRRSRGRHTAADLAQTLAMSFAYSAEFAFGRTTGQLTSFFGNAILSAVPLEDVRVAPLPTLYDWTRRRFWGTSPGTRRVGQRGGVIARVELGGQSVTVGLVHLENRVGPEGRGHQMTHFLASLPPRGAAIVGGDLNTTTINLVRRRDCMALLARLPLDPRRLRRPEPYEPLFKVIEQARFEYHNANQPLAPTYTPIGLIPPFLRAKLDWIMLRELNAIPGSAQVVRARDGLRRLSDHDFVVCEFEF